MSDMLVNLLRLPPLAPEVETLGEVGVVVRRARVYEIGAVRAFIEKHFDARWADEISVGFAYKPVTIFIATRDGAIIGFAAYECTCKAFFGPTGVAPAERGRRVGRALLVASLWGLRESGYAYAFIGGVGPADFYARAVGATLIPDSTPGIYADPLKPSS